MTSPQATYNLRSRREVGSSESSDASKVPSSLWNTGTKSSQTDSTAESPISPITRVLSESVDTSIHPTTLATAYTLDSPSLEELAGQIELLKQQLASPSPPSSQYILVINIPHYLFSTLEHEPDLFKGVRATIFHQKSQVLYKVMTGLQHEQMIGSFQAWICETLIRMGLSLIEGDFVFRQSARTRGHTSSKEPDFWFGPNNVHINGGGSGVPSLALEVGFSESSPQLHNDARWWYANSNGLTRIAVLIHANKPPGNDWIVDIEVWTEENNDHEGPATRDRPTNTIKRTQHAHIENDVVTGAPLVLDFQTLMCRPPANPQEGDLVLNERWIRAICAKVVVT
ncbi:hypothetical protein NUU61_003574 [Penicillium alfredii]|uniref:Uncharacterized protein n=1 Tax=Penicillium alfredii TaxID=1506179 RepID=A0A9W9FJL6_9EURO|nr:uncharacterized protein NUU61_003574 [Penicillium alfredii]KAJ5101352.1 hypothetical protein NUU61_003574 [Penicillium alfredii]